MSKTLIIAEKPSAAKDFKTGLEKYGKFTNIDRGYESDNYLITWMQGHILSLMEPKEYSNWGGKWSLSILPWFPPNDQYEYKVPKQTSQIVKQVSAIMKRSDIDLVVNACDAGREGDLIFWEIYDHLKLKKPVKRFWESAVLTPANIQRIMQNELKGDDFILPRKDAAYARAFADLLLGMNFTVGFTAKAQSLLHMGRVQTPTIAILVQRKLEIDNFKPEDYYEIQATFKNEHGEYKGMWFKTQLGNTKFDKKEDAEKVVALIKGKTGLVTKKDVKNAPEAHPLLYSLTTLQQHANRKYGFTATKTLEVAQSLYETHKILSYPRSESEVIGAEHVSKLEPTLKAIDVGDYHPFVEHILDEGIKTTKRMVNDDKLTDHHAIIPTEVTPDLSKLNTDEKKIYDLVVKRFLSAFYPPAMYEKTEIVTEVEKETFKTSGKIELDPGWKVVYGAEAADNDEDDKKEENGDAMLPPISKGDTPDVKDQKLLEKQTQPPKHYNEASLLGVMKNPKKLLEDKELQKAMAEANEGQGAGLGTTATRDSIIENIISRGYVERKGKQLIATDLGVKLISVCPDELKSPEITAEWEQKLRHMEQGKIELDHFMDEIKRYITDNIQNLSSTTLNVSFSRNNDQSTGYKCPKCKSDIVLRTTQKGSFYVCSNGTKENPCIFFPEKMLNKKLTKTHLTQLFEKGETAEISGFKSPTKKTTFSAKVAWDLEKNRVTFVFPERPKAQASGIECPFCGGAVVESEFAFGCSNWKDKNCKFSVWKNKSKKLTIEQVSKMINESKTDVIDDMISKKGTKFKAYYELDKNGKKIEMKFAN